MKNTLLTSVLFAGSALAVPAQLEVRQDPAESNFLIYGGSESISSGSGVIIIDKNGFKSS